MTRILKLSLFFSALYPLASVHAQTTTVVVQKSQAAPDGNGTFSQFRSPTLNDAGQAAFLASLTGTSGGSSDDFGIFLGDGAGGLTQIARTGQAAPDSNGTFSDFDFGDPALNNAGQAAFAVRLTGVSGGSSDEFGIFFGDEAGGLTQIARTGQAAPDGNGTLSRFSNFPAFNDAGQAVFVGFLADSDGELTGGFGYFRGDGVTGPTRIARTGQAAPDGNGTFSGLSIAGRKFRPALNSTGEAAFLARLTGGSGIFRGDSLNNLTQIARTGQAAPDGNGTFSDSGLGDPAFNNAGQAAFLARLTGVSGGSNDEFGIFLGDGASGLTQIARTGQAAPNGNGTFSGFGFGDPALNNAGQAAFLARLTGTSGGIGIFRGDGATDLTQIALTGQAAPGGNGTFSNSGFGDLALNDAGQAAFVARLTGTSGRFSDNEGIFFH
ncbi:MAG: hypothetical protein GXP24_11575, partial [Planctomycetes bacterium]|nr:hypothetical protein [Planctomycetota bacterium]